jgi:hypothetical protein
MILRTLAAQFLPYLMVEENQLTVMAAFNIGPPVQMVF